MKNRSFRLPVYMLFVLFLFFYITKSAIAFPLPKKIKDTIIIKPGILNEMVSADWKNALSSRMSKEYIDSLARLQRALTAEEQSWENLLHPKTKTWNTYKDSLAAPFVNVEISDTTYVLLGYRGRDDGFTYGYQTVCLDLTALNSEYGRADLPENSNRIDRIFAHEYTHLLHKLWAKKMELKLQAFRDSILWECLYEGIGMYRSLNPKWIPVQGVLPDITKAALDNLYPTFVDRLITIQTNNALTAEEKKQLNKNLSRGAVNQKWGAFPVAIWLSLESNGDDKKLRDWINKGPAAVIQLAKKYLNGEHRQKFTDTFK
ncbi:MAG TPA: hypothetical protein VJU78_19005 [Chitinophagaceae bacterium]|nr:hypothetical protein [Chitinophagaceae bacterium]